MVTAVRSYGDSYIGRRSNNEDSLGKREPADPELRARLGCLYIVCDGMGGHSAGEIASRLAVETVLKEYYVEGGDPQENLVRAIQKANDRIYEAAGEDLAREGMGSTVVVCVILNGSALIAHVGDSRAYLLRDGVLTQLTRDHLHVTEDLGVEQQEAKKHHLRHMLSRALGAKAQVRVDIETVAAREGDRFLLCTDGLSNVLPESELVNGLGDPAPREAVMRLLRQAEAGQADDNCSCIVVALVAQASAAETPSADEATAASAGNEAAAGPQPEPAQAASPDPVPQAGEQAIPAQDNPTRESQSPQSAAGIEESARKPRLLRRWLNRIAPKIDNDSDK